MTKKTKKEDKIVNPVEDVTDLASAGELVDVIETEQTITETQVEPLVEQPVESTKEENLPKPTQTLSDKEAEASLIRWRRQGRR